LQKTFVAFSIHKAQNGIRHSVREVPTLAAPTIQLPMSGLPARAHRS
jgi:hypothetical protein